MREIPLLRDLEATRCRIRNERVIARAALATGHALPKAARPAGDEATLRGIPAIGWSVAGAINGTNPEREACRAA